MRILLALDGSAGAETARALVGPPGLAHAVDDRVIRVIEPSGPCMATPRSPSAGRWKRSRRREIRASSIEPRCRAGAARLDVAAHVVVGRPADVDHRDRDPAARRPHRHGQPRPRDDRVDAPGIRGGGGRSRRSVPRPRGQNDGIRTGVVALDASPSSDRVVADGGRVAVARTAPRSTSSTSPSRQSPARVRCSRTRTGRRSPGTARRSSRARQRPSNA